MRPGNFSLRPRARLLAGLLGASLLIGSLPASGHIRHVVHHRAYRYHTVKTRRIAPLVVIHGQGDYFYSTEPVAARIVLPKPWYDGEQNSAARMMNIGGSSMEDFEIPAVRGLHN